MSKLRINLFGESFRISRVSHIPAGFLQLEPVQFNENLSTLILDETHPLIFETDIVKLTGVCGLVRGNSTFKKDQ